MVGEGPAMVGEGPVMVGEGPVMVGEGPVVLGEGPVIDFVNLHTHLSSFGHLLSIVYLYCIYRNASDLDIIN